MSILIRSALLTDLDQLVVLEKTCFDTDQLSRRSFKHWISAEHRALLVAEQECVITGYVLIIYHPGTRLARVYSLAVALTQRGTGVAKLLMSAGEQAANDAGRLYLRLEVSVDNISAIKLYETLGYQKFGLYRDYYEDHKDALRYQKRIRRYQRYLATPLGTLDKTNHAVYLRPRIADDGYARPKQGVSTLAGRRDQPVA